MRWLHGDCVGAHGVAKPNLPFVVDGDVIVSQSNACLTYLGRKLGERSCRYHPSPCHARRHATC